MTMMTFDPSASTKSTSTWLDVKARFAAYKNRHPALAWSHLASAAATTITSLASLVVALSSDSETAWLVTGLSLLPATGFDVLFGYQLWQSKPEKEASFSAQEPKAEPIAKGGKEAPIPDVSPEEEERILVLNNVIALPTEEMSADTALATSLHAMLTSGCCDKKEVRSDLLRIGVSGARLLGNLLSSLRHKDVSDKELLNEVVLHINFIVALAGKDASTEILFQAARYLLGMTDKNSTFLDRPVLRTNNTEVLSLVKNGIRGAGEADDKADILMRANFLLDA